jgi:hypothetical protein
MKYEVSVTKTYVQKHIVKADDISHALEIASEISDGMETNHKTFSESSREAAPVGEAEKVTYEPEQNYLK